MKFVFPALSLIAALFPPAAFAGEWPTLSPLKGSSPVIDGRLRPGEWAEARSLGPFRDNTGAHAKPATEAWVVNDENFLYVAFRCEEPRMENIHTETIGDQRDAPVWFDDSVDFYIDIGNTGASVFRIAVNSEGTLFDGEGNEDHDYPAWDSGAEVRTSRHQGYWEVEIAIPLEAFRHRPVAGEVIAVNAGRIRFAGGSREITGISGPHLRPFKRFTRFLYDQPAGKGEVSLVSDRRGPFYAGLPAEWSFVAANRGERTATLHIEFPGKKGAEREEIVPPGEHRFSLPVAAGEVEAMSHCVITMNGEPFYEGIYRTHLSEVVHRVPEVSQPFFSELIEARPEGLSKEGFLLWSHDASGPPEPGEFSMRTGAAYSQEQLFEKLGKEGAILIAQSSIATNTRRLELAQRHGVRCVIILDERASRDKGALMTDKKAVWFFDPLAKEAYFEDLRKAIALAKENETVWGVFLGDETWTKILRNLFWFIEQGPEAIPQLKEMDAKIKAEFGVGKHGLPESVSDTDPFRWIATYRWLSSELVKMQREVKQIVKAECPRLKIVAWDNQSGHLPYEIARWHGDFDVMTGQIYPSLNPARDLTGFSSRLYRDLAGVPELWPCVHIEHFAANFTPYEVEGLLSRAFAGGATGLHLYMSDTKGRRAGIGGFPTDRYGAPERWAATTKILERLKHAPFRVKQPMADSIIFYSNPSYQGQGGERPKTTEVEWLYNILGPRLQGAIRFVDELVLEREPDLLLSHKVVYIPYAPIVEDAEYERLVAFVKAGGTLIICDPQAFRYRPDGSKRDPSVLLRKQERQSVQAAQKEPLRRKVGRGTVLAFAENPLRVPSVISDKAWLDLFRSLHTSAGGAVDLPAWQFRFPKAPTFVHQRPKGECLTGNYFQWILSEPRPVANRVVRGSYQLSRAASGEAADTPIPFHQGKLTDRHRAVQLAADSPMDDYALTWKMNAPLSITITFESPVTPTLLRLFTRGTLPAGSYEVLGEDEQWEAIASWEESPQEHSINVSMHTINLPPSQNQQGRIRLKTTAQEATFTLAELDLWEEKQ